MGLWNYLRTQVTGVDLNATQASMNQSDAQLRAVNEAALRSGLYNKPTCDAAQANWSTSIIPDASAQVGQAFQDGAKQGFDNVTSRISQSITLPARWSLRFLWQSIPGWLWFVLLLGVLWYFGILQRLVKAGTDSAMRKVGA